MRIFLCALVLMIFGAASVQAGVVTIDGGWNRFQFDDVGSPADENPFTFNATGPVNLTVVDAYNSGDQFQVWDNGVLLGLTSAPGSTGDLIGSNYDAAAADSRWSKGVYLLSAGPHSITIFVELSPYGGGGAALRVDTANAAVPEPSSIVMLGLGGMGMGLAAWRRKRLAVA